MNINKTGFSTDHAISLTNTFSSQREDVKKIEEKAREQIKNNPVDQFARADSGAPVNLTATVVELYNREKFNFIIGINEISIDDKRTIMNLIEKTTQKASAGNGDYFQMERAQTGMQLQLIAEKLIPEKYQEQMQQAIKDYQEEEFNHAKRSYEQMITKFENDKSDLGKRMFARFTAALPIFISQEEKVKGFYQDIDLSNPSKLAESFEKALADMGDEQKKSMAHVGVIQADQEALRTKWNEFTSIFPRLQSFQLPTAQKAVYDFSV
ncbi:hypothetical protein [Jeotgalibacillus sp. R-1-5s-1]|uniref:hypothetical protein n=1 Tax=Jeotgalibacillus sp. R-1-5s-1 TaxID=2555897 RepID=UPI00106BB499|nr:hypothetical protein [Jeotgalibacillus sp. R-1-5s-1]TFD94358.1 hypothetical protein E2491_13015 [Jeotgalibacillus sp. R-1-5s-1]